MITLRGTVEDIIYKNDENGYTVAIIETEDGFVTANGIMPTLEQGLDFALQGEFTRHPKYGEQFKVTTCEEVLPTERRQVIRYLSSGLIDGVGETLAGQIVDAFGDDVFAVLDEHPERLLEIHGIGKKKLAKIVASYSENRALQTVLMGLQQYDLSTGVAMKIYRRFGQEALEMIRENPYLLAEEVRGIGFKLADQIAQKMGIERDAPYRCQAALLHVLAEDVSAGHTYSEKASLVERTRFLIGVSAEQIQTELMDMAIDGRVNLDGERFYLPALFHAETTFCANLLRLKQGATELDYLETIEDLIGHYEKEEDISLGEEQREAIAGAYQSGVVVITGGPGTGKTTIIKGLISVFHALDQRVALAAPTGRAAKRMFETTGLEAKTIHRLLEYQFSEEEEMLSFGRNEANPLGADVVIIDEVSMVDVILAHHLLTALAPGTRLVLVGDHHQLPSVGPGKVLEDIIQSEILPVFRLEKIYRQQEESMIPFNARRIREGDLPILNEKGKDFFFIDAPTPEKVLSTIGDLVSYRLKDYYDVDPFYDIQLLSPMKKYKVGVNSLNLLCQNLLNPAAPGKDEKAYAGNTYRVGDKVMQIKNNYEIDWVTPDGEEGKGVFNGDIGIIEAFDKEASTVRVFFDDDRRVHYGMNQLDELMHAYCVTVHKSQGNEFPVVIMPLTGGPPMLMNRNILYTAVTRAKELVVLVGSRRYLQQMIDTTDQNDRRSGVLERFGRLRKIYFG